MNNTSKRLYRATVLGLAVSLGTPILAADTSKKSIYDEEQVSYGDVRAIKRYPLIEMRFKKAREWLSTKHFGINQAAENITDVFFTAESSVASTLQSLKSHNENERLLPGLVYILLATMSGSILARNRTISTRVLAPAIASVIATNYFLPGVASNITTLLFQYEQQIPQLAQTRGAISAKLQHVWKTTASAIDGGVNSMDTAWHDGRQFIQDNTGLKLVKLKKE